MPSKEYGRTLRLMRQHHLTRKTFSGNGVLKHAAALISFSWQVGAESGIDYGAGKGAQYTATVNSAGGGEQTLVEALGYDPFKYDPAWAEFETPPTEPADLVWCVDVLECVPEQDMDWIIAELARLAVKGLFVTVASYPSKKDLPDGRNAHVTVKPEEWWREKFAPLAIERPDLEIILLVA